MSSNTRPYNIVPVEISMTLIGMIVGIGILTLPRSLAEEGGTIVALLSILIGSLLTILFIVVYTKLQRNFPGETLLEAFTNTKAGSWLAKFLGMAFACYFLLLLAYETRILSIVVRIYLLIDTPAEVVAAVFLLTTTYAVTKGLQGIIHLNLMFVPITVFFLIAMMIVVLPEFDYELLLPLTVGDSRSILQGVKETTLSLLGVEIIFFFLAAMKKENLKVAPMIASVVIIFILYLGITIISFAIFSVGTTEVLTFPTVELVKEIEIPGGVFERVEALMITIWMMSIFNTMSVAHFLATKIVRETLDIKEHSRVLPSWITLVTLIIAFIPRSISEAFLFGEIVGFLGIGLIIISLVCATWIVLKRKKQQGGAR
ncbi:spore germination protein [Alkalihalobacillus oceani]|uniref:GerAB/ArcD/ProY family transporter n=1 Tax=Halalkalibacter oceani TaxID=1653776 RepID=UPI00203AA984|nr:GerAB/ArcD/ProY family transporter [Halalkalibacter oceani]MCM3762916.1 spore germination protein [Halalkalibacter oceani]